MNERAASSQGTPCASEPLVEFVYLARQITTQERPALSSEALHPSRDARRAWQQLLEVSSRTLRAIDAALDESERLMVSEFDVLITLENAPNGHLRMTDLAHATMLSSGGLTRLVGRLEGRGFVRRDVDPADGRAFYASLTPAGHEKLTQARKPHDAVVQRQIADKLTPKDLSSLETTLKKLLT